MFEYEIKSTILVIELDGGGTGTFEHFGNVFFKIGHNLT